MTSHWQVMTEYENNMSASNQEILFKKIFVWRMDGENYFMDYSIQNMHAFLKNELYRLK